MNLLWSRFRLTTINIHHVSKQAISFELPNLNETFRKGYTQNYTNKFFTITKIAAVSPNTFKIVDANNEIILGKFYEPEIVKVDVQ